MTKAIPDIPRRCRVDLYSPGEIAIRQAMIVVEKMGAAVALTDAVVLLSQAKDRVADFVDEVDLPKMGSAKSSVIQCDCGATDAGNWADVHAPECTSTVNLSAFMRKFSELCHHFKIGITGDASLFVMEGDDLLHDYTIDADSKLHLGATS